MQTLLTTETNQITSPGAGKPRSAPLIIALLWLSLATSGLSTPASAQSEPIVAITRGINGETLPDYSSLESMSADGRYTVFSSYMPVPAGSSPAEPPTRNLFLFDADLGSFMLITGGMDGPANGSSYGGAIDATGRYIVFDSEASNLVAGDNNTFSDVFVYDRLDGVISLVSINQFNQAGDGNSVSPSISDDGRHVSFYSFANNLDLGSTVFRETATIMVVDRDSDGNGDFDDPGTLIPKRVIPDSIPAQSDPGFRFSALLSADGRYLGFTSRRPELSAGVGQAGSYLYLHNRDVDGNGVFDEPAQTAITLISPVVDGEVVEVTSFSMSADATVFSTLIRVSVDDRFRVQAALIDLDPARSGSPQPSNGVTTMLSGHDENTYAASLSRSGRYLITVGDLGGLGFPGDLFLWDRVTDQSTLVSVSPFGRAANRSSGPGLASDDGARVAFNSRASNLVQFDTNRGSDVFLANIGQPGPPGPVPRDCEDLLDNDNDGSVDMDDSGCSAPNDSSESTLESPLAMVVVSSIGQRAGSAILLDSQGITGASPSIVVDAGGGSHVAYVREAYDSVVNRMRDFVRLAIFDGIYWRSQTVAPGTAPSVAVDAAGTAHLAFHDSREGDLLYATVNQSVVETTIIDDAGTTGLMPVMLLTANEEPWVVYFDPDDSTIRLWRGIGNSQLNLETGVQPCGLDAALTSDDQVAVVYVNCDDDTIRYAASGGNVATGQTLFASFGFGVNVSIDHDINDLPVITYRSSVRQGMVYARPVAGSWVSQELPDTQGDFRADTFFSSDGITPYFIVGGDDGLWRIQLQNNSFQRSPVGQQQGRVRDFSAAPGPDGNLRVAYFDQDSRNLLHTTENSNGWQFQTVAATPNGGARDLEFFNQHGGQPPSVVTFDSEFPGGLGQFSVSGRFPDTGWVPSNAGSGAPQDDFDSAVVRDRPNLIREAAHFDNVNGELRYLIETSDGLWTAEPVTSVARFSQIRDIKMVRIGGSPAVVGVISGGAEGGNGDQLVAFLRQLDGSWQERRLSTSPTESMGPAAAALGGDGRVYMAYLDERRGDARMGIFDGQSWTDEAIDFGGDNNFGRALAITTTREQLRGRAGVTVPVVAYLNTANDRVRVASKVARWQTYEYQQSVPGTNNLALVLEGQSRLRPMVLASTWDGLLTLYRQTAGSEIQAESETVATDYDGSNPIFLALNPSPIAVYTDAGGNTQYGLGSALPGIPAAREGDQPGASQVTQDLCFGNVKSALPQSKVDGVLDDESTLQRWESQFSRTSEGQRYIDFFRQDFPKAFRIIAQDPGLLMDANAALQNFMPGIQAMVQGQGSAVVISQDMINDGRDIWQRLSDRDSGSLSDFIEAELARWNQLDDFVGMTFQEWAITIGVDASGTPASESIFFDGFEP